MRSSLRVREINYFEKKMISKSISYITEDQINSLNEFQSQLYVSIKKDESKTVYPKVFYLSNDLIKTIKKIEDKSKFVSIGIYFGFFKRGQLLLSLEGGELLNDLNLISDKFKYYINGNAEKSILYGNDVRTNMLKTTQKLAQYHLIQGDLIFLFNDEDNLISISLLIQDGKKLLDLNDNEIIAKNLVDKGYYLRKEQ